MGGEETVNVMNVWHVEMFSSGFRGNNVLDGSPVEGAEPEHDGSLLCIVRSKHPCEPIQMSIS